jgi:type IV secretion system protein VirB6
MITCAQSDFTQPIAERVAGYLDCQAQSIAQTGFANLSAGWLLGGCLTIYVALIGYRLIFGSPFGPREAVLASLRAGVVIAMATSWPAYDATIYRVVVDGPAEIATQLLPADISSPSLPDAARRLDAYFEAMPASAAPSVAAAPPDAGAVTQTSQAPADDTDPVLGRAGLLLVAISVGSLGALQLAGGVLLGVGPLFATLGLFDTTLGLLVGWARALFGVFLGAVGCTVATALELGFIESQALAGPALAEPALLVSALLFAAATVIVIVLGFVVGFSFRIPSRSASTIAGERLAAAPHQISLAPRWERTPMTEPAPRAQTVADAVRRLGLRDTVAAAIGADTTGSGVSGAAVQVLAGQRAAVVGGLTAGAINGAGTRRRLSRPRTPSAEDRNRRR